MLGLALLLALVVFQRAAQAATLNVTSTGDSGDSNLGDGVCNDGTGKCTLRAAIEQAGSGDTIIQAALAPGVATHRVMTVTGDTSVAISGMTIRHGNADTTGGQCQVIDRTAPHHGGGLRNTARLILSNVVVTNNKARCEGGGIFNSGSLVLRSSTVSANLLNGNSSGGGIINGGGMVNIMGSTISANNVGGGPADGGGLYNFDQGTMNITNSTISGNHSVQGHGGGIINFSSLTITNSTIASNVAVSIDKAGGIRNVSGTFTIANTIFANNRGCLIDWWAS